jgi:hypothetical protein
VAGAVVVLLVAAGVTGGKKKQPSSPSAVAATSVAPSSPAPVASASATLAASRAPRSAAVPSPVSSLIVEAASLRTDDHASASAGHSYDSAYSAVASRCSDGDDIAFTISSAVQVLQTDIPSTTDLSFMRGLLPHLGHGAKVDCSNAIVDYQTALDAAAQQALTTTAAPPPSSALPPVPAGDGTYTNVDGNQIPDPVSAPAAPAGATAQCGDGTYSFSQHHSGTCSHHGGVATWL